jgi:hypothetical protein
MSNMLNTKFRLLLTQKVPHEAAFIGQNWHSGLIQFEKPLLVVFLLRHDYRDNHVATVD